MDIILEIIFSILLVILFSLGEIARIDLPNNIAIIGMDVGIAILFISGISNFLLKRKKNVSPLLKPLLIFFLTCSISLLVNSVMLTKNEFIVAGLYLVRFTSYASIFLIVSQLNQDIKNRIPIYMGICGFLVVLGGIFQYFFYPSLRNLYYLGWDVHLYRMFGTFLDPNFLGAFLVLYFLFMLSYITNKTTRSKKIFVILLLVLLVIVVSIVLTYSRSAYLMLAIGIIIFVGFKKPTKQLLMGCCVLTIVGLVSFFTFTKYSEGTNLFRINSTKARITTSQNALFIFQKNPIFGVGFDAYRYAQQRYGFIKREQVTVDHGGAGADNSFLFVLATTGVVGFLAYTYLWVRILWQKRNPLLLSSAIAIFVDSLFINSLFYPFIMVWMWLLIGLTENRKL